MNLTVLGANHPNFTVLTGAAHRPTRGPARPARETSTHEYAGIASWRGAE